MENLEKKIAKIGLEIATLEDEGDKWISEAQEWANKRDYIHEQIKDLREEATNARSKRDALNEKVRKHKSLREDAKKERKKKIARIIELRIEMKDLLKKRPPNRLSEIQKETENIEWKIQTTSLTLHEEKKLIDRVAYLEAKLIVLKRIRTIEEELGKLQMEIKMIDDEILLHHKMLSELAEESQKFHNVALKNQKKTRSLLCEADNAHQKHVEASEQVKLLQRKRFGHLSLKTSIEQRLTRINEEKETQRRIELTKDLKEKFRRGEKLNWNEFKILAEERFSKRKDDDVLTEP